MKLCLVSIMFWFKITIKMKYNKEMPTFCLMVLIAVCSLIYSTNISASTMCQGLCPAQEIQQKTVPVIMRLMKGVVNKQLKLFPSCH